MIQELTEMDIAAVAAYKLLQAKYEFSFYAMFKAGAEWQKS